MHKNIRKSDSLAHATGSFLTGFDEINEKWNSATMKIINIGPKVVDGIQDAINLKGKIGSKKEVITKSLANLGKIFNEMERINAEKIDMMIDMEGLDFPLKAPKKIISLCRKEEEISRLLQTITHNLSKTVIFVGDSETDVELLENSLSSFRTSIDDFTHAIAKGHEMNNFLQQELQKEHKKAQKYVDMV